MPRVFSRAMRIMKHELIYSLFPEPFSFYRAILKSDHLHFGLWPDSPSKCSLEEAQENLFNLLLSFLPSPPAKVLDVGCGLGYSAALLADRGYEVTAIAPSPELIAYARQEYGNSSVDFRVLSYFDDDRTVFSEERYDVLLFQESTQYLSPLDDVMKKARYILKENGLIIIGDEVCYDREIKPETAVHLSANFITALSENGFRIIEHREVGDKVSQTCDVIIDKLTLHYEALLSQPGASDAASRLLYYLNGWRKQKNWYLRNQMGYEIFVARKDAFFIRSYSAGDEHRILPMFNTIFHVSRTFDHWYWKFRDNPFGAHKIAEAYDKDGNLVAHYAGYPVPFYSALDNGNAFLTYQIGDTMTSPSVRNIGIGKTGLLARTASYFYAKFCEAVPFIYGFNTGNIKKLGMRYLRYEYIDPVPYWIRNVVESPLKPPSLFMRFFSGYAVKEIHAVTGDWDDFFRRVRPSYGFLIQRDAAYMRWRYFDCPDKVHRIFAVRKRGLLVGWSVFSEKDKKLIWGDALFDINHPESVAYLLFTLSNKYFPGVESIEGWFSPNPEWWTSLLGGMGFNTVREPNDLTPGFVLFDDASLMERLKRHLYYTMGDSDLF